MRFRPLGFAAVLAVLPLLDGCSRAKKADPGEEIAVLVNADDRGQDGIVAQFTEPTHFEKGIGLHAIADGPNLTISLRNKTGKPIQFLPRDFALITSPRREDLVIITPAEGQINASGVDVAEDGYAFLRVTLRRVSEASGKRLVYNNPRDGIMFFITVE